MVHPLSTPGYRKLLDLQRRIHEFTLLACADDDVDIRAPDLPLWSRAYQYLSIAPLLGGLQVEYFGELWEEPFAWTLACLADQEVADAIVALSFTGPDEGANGTREWEFTPLVDSAVRFPVLKSLAIRPSGQADHNVVLIQRAGTIMEESGEIARFAAKAPALTQLTVPNAPDASFFDVPLPYLQTLVVESGFDTQAFIENLASSTNLTALRSLDFTESTELHSTWADAREAGCITPFSAYEQLLRSETGERLRALTLRNTCLSLEQLQALQALRPKLGMMVVQSPRGGYVSHFRQDVFPWRHLVQPDPGVR